MASRPKKSHEIQDGGGRYFEIRFNGHNSVIIAHICTHQQRLKLKMTCVSEKGLLRSAVSHTVSTVRSSTGVPCLRSFAVRSVYGWPQSSSGESWPCPTSESGCRRMTVKSASARQSTMRQLRLTIFSKCLDDVEAWLSSSRLRLNLPRRKCCGWALSTNCSSSAFTTFQSCRHPSGLSTQHVT